MLPEMLVSGFAPAASRPFGSRTSFRSLFDSSVDRDPARSFRRSLHSTSLEQRSRRARPPPLARCPARRAGAPARVGASRWRPRSIDRCLQLTDVVFKDDRPTSWRTSHQRFPRDARACGFTPQRPLRRAERSRSKHCPLRSRIERRTSDTPSPRASPAELCPPVSARDRLRDLRSKTRGLGPLHQAA